MCVMLQFYRQIASAHIILFLSTMYFYCVYPAMSKAQKKYNGKIVTGEKQKQESLQSFSSYTSAHYCDRFFPLGLSE
jgi:hypothetical protein